MFRDNKYTKWYYEIVNSALNRTPKGYTEKHRIIPGCLGGKYVPGNVVHLTAREHFVCHMLLTKMSNEPGPKFAFVMMGLENPKQQRYKITSQQYEYLKKCNSEASKQRMLGHPGHNLGKVKAWKDDQTRFFPKDHVPEGWTLGHNPNTRKKIGAGNKGRIYCFNPETNEVRTVSNRSEIPKGWKAGNPNANTSSHSSIPGTRYYHNPVTGEEGRFQAGKEPPNWKLGRGVFWINNNEDNKQHPVNLPIPSGWKKGRLIKWRTR